MRVDAVSDARWSAVDTFFAQTLQAGDPVLDEVLARSDAAGLPSISVTALQGRLLQLLAESGLAVITADDLGDAAKKAVEAAKRQR